MVIQFVLNGKQIEADVEPHRRLSSLLQDVLQIKSLRHNCQNGACGSCLVLWQGKSASSCMIPAFMVRRTEVTTIEGLSGTQEFVQLERAFHEAGAQFCPYCASPRVLSVAALLRRNLRPDDKMINDCLSIVRCRCSGYEALREAIKLAAAYRRQYGL